MHANLPCPTNFAPIGGWQPLHHDTIIWKQCMWGNMATNVVVVVVDFLLLATLPFAPSLTMCG